jgi:hypothetical protein
MKQLLVMFALASLGAAPRGRYLSASGTVTDRETGLVWAEAPARQQTFAEAQATCAASMLAGQRGWRLPTIKQLQSVLDDSDLVLKLDPAFRSLRSAWSATPGAAPSSHWALNLQGVSDNVVVAVDSSVFEVLCVR